jgi:hypothetical protein
MAFSLLQRRIVEFLNLSQLKRVRRLMDDVSVQERSGGHAERE